MAELNVNDITTNTIDPTDKVYGFSADESKAPTVQTLLGTAPGIMAVGTCATAAATAAKAVTSDNWTAKPGQSILIEFTNANTANNVTLSINQGNAIPVYYLNCATEQISGNAIPAGAVIFTLNAAGTKFYAHLTKTLSVVDTTSKLPVDSTGVRAIHKEIVESMPCSSIGNSTSWVTKSGVLPNSYNRIVSAYIKGYASTSAIFTYWGFELRVTVSGSSYLLAIRKTLSGDNWNSDIDVVIEYI